MVGSLRILRRIGWCPQEPAQDEGLEVDLVPWQAMPTPSTTGGKLRRVPPAAHPRDAAMEHQPKQQMSAVSLGTADSGSPCEDSRSGGSSDVRSNSSRAQANTLSRFAPTLAGAKRACEGTVGPGAGRDDPSEASATVRATAGRRQAAAAGIPFVAVSRTARLQV